MLLSFYVLVKKNYVLEETKDVSILFNKKMKEVFHASKMSNKMMRRKKL